MAKSDYEIGNVTHVYDGKPIKAVDKISPFTERKGTVFRKQYSNDSEIGVSAPTNTYTVGISDADSNEYAPFNRLEVHNDGDVAVDIEINGSTTNKQRAPPGCVTAFGKYDSLAFWLIKIKNVSDTTTIPAEAITVQVSKVNE